MSSGNAATAVRGRALNEAPGLIRSYQCDGPRATPGSHLASWLGALDAAPGRLRERPDLTGPAEHLVDFGEMQ